MIARWPHPERNVLERTEPLLRALLWVSGGGGASIPSG